MRARTVRAVLASAAVVAAIALAGCNADMVPNGRAQAPLSEKMLSEITAKNMDKESPILVRIFKEESELEVWKQTRDGEYALLKSYPVCRWSGDLGPKKKEGDRQAPEGFYTITPGQMNPNSSYYLAFNTGFPNAYDRSHGYTGSELMVHGDCSSRGCYAMTDEQIQEIYALARESFFGGQKAFQLQAFPFRMTALNMAKHRNSPHFAFWKMLKEGYDNFEASKQEPKVAVCEKKYVFDPAATDDKPLKFNAAGKCPVYQLDQNIADAVLDHRRKEQVQMAQYIAQGVATATPRHGIDGGMNPVFAEKLGAQDGYDSKGRPIQVAAAPGSLPRGDDKPAPATIVSVPRAPQTQPEPAQVQLASVPVPQPAPLPKAGEAPVQSASIGGLIGNLFGNSGTADTSAQVQVPPPAPSNAAPAARTTARPLTRTANVAPVSPPAKPKAVAAAPAAASPRVAQAEPSAAAAEPAPQLRTAFSAQPANSGGVLTGAQPVMPVGSFDQRWSGGVR
ncbi:L,D-transpeptidase family protein [Undibacter mobilis]|uniref:L,D-transpeptidase family protein n=1 Tax=Undibacter mobilis TaxID=2292256 RepID=UPI001FE08CF0|nr:murein L,D-transpeptidase family protein [Undibacter mobilis]